MVKTEHVTFEYFRRDDDGNVTEIVEAVKDVSLQIKQGDFIGILGRNGSGKSTFAKLLNALLEPSEGQIMIMGKDTMDEENTWKIRSDVGMVFQNPDNQIIGSEVEEDVAFGPENLGIPTDDISERVANALEMVGMSAYCHHSPNRLSGGQKQRVAIAGVLAMRPKCIIFDEATAMLDPKGRKEVLQAAKELNKTYQMTIIYITHDMEEVVEADRIFVMHQGKLVKQGTPEEVFCNEEELREYGLKLPGVTRLAGALRQNGIDIQTNIFTVDDLIREVNRVKAYAQVQDMRMVNRFMEHKSHSQKEHMDASKEASRNSWQNAMTDGLVLDQVSYEYGSKTAYAHMALEDVSLTIGKGEFIALVGATGSGKSTLIQHFNGLLRPTNGTVYYEGSDIHEKGYKRAQLRGKIGLVFQYPESQLFAQTVLEDVCFGPKNQGLPLLETQRRAFEAIKAVGLEDSVYDLSPFDLSGGQKRRVAIAGVLAMKPDILVLDEPVAGLDPLGRESLLKLLQELNRQGMTIVLVSHNMEDVAEYAGRVVMLDSGKVVFDGDVKEAFQNRKQLMKLGLELPMVTEWLYQLKVEGHMVNPTLYRLEDAIQELTGYLA